MSIHFRTLFEVEIAHAYYEGECKDIEFIVPANTPALAAGRLLARVRNGRLVVLFEADGADHALRDISGTTLLIGLRVTNSYFANFTAPPVAAGYLPIFANKTQPKAFDAAIAGQVAGLRQRLSPTLAGRPLQYQWQLSATTVAEQTLAAGQEDVTCVTSGWPSGLYELTESDGATNRLSHWLVHPELAGEHLWGALAVTIDASFYTTSPILQVKLQPRREQIKYYVVARNYGPSEFSHLNVVDAGADEQGRDPVTFNMVGTDDFSKEDDLPPVVLGVGEAKTQVVLFQSSGEVDRRAGGYRKLQLRRNTEVLVQHLPQAGSDRVQARFIVHLAKS